MMWQCGKAESRPYFRIQRTREYGRMMIRRVNDDVAVSAQIAVEDVGEIARQGFRAIVCNRPDGETADQPEYAAIEAAAKEAGLQVHWQPVVSGNVTDGDGAEFGKVLAGLPKPVLAYCRSGTRCVTLWSLSQAGKQPVADILAAAGGAGYDLSPLGPRLEYLAHQKNG